MPLKLSEFAKSENVSQAEALYCLCLLGGYTADPEITWEVALKLKTLCDRLHADASGAAPKKTVETPVVQVVPKKRRYSQRIPEGYLSQADLGELLGLTASQVSRSVCAGRIHLESLGDHISETYAQELMKAQAELVAGGVHTTEEIAREAGVYEAAVSRAVINHAIDKIPNDHLLRKGDHMHAKVLFSTAAKTRILQVLKEEFPHATPESAPMVTLRAWDICKALKLEHSGFCKVRSKAQGTILWPDVGGTRYTPGALANLKALQDKLMGTVVTFKDLLDKYGFSKHAAHKVLKKAHFSTDPCTCLTKIPGSHTVGKHIILTKEQLQDLDPKFRKVAAALAGNRAVMAAKLGKG